MIRVGTSGFSYADWVGPFYPHGTRATSMLPLYAREFDALEVNFTYHRLPAPGQLAAMSERCADRLTFAVKAWQGMTHTAEASGADLAAFTAALAPLAERGVLGAVLLQYPGSFRFTPGAIRRVAALGQSLRPFPDVAEFRHYLKEKLKPYYHLPYDRACMHEVVFSGKRQKAKEVHTVDIAKRLLDYGLHPPTVYFPLIVEEALMIEPTETESKQTLDAFVEAMK